MLEEWRSIRGYEGLYQVSNLGRVKSFPRKFTHKGDVIILPHRSDKGYLYVTLSKNGRTKHFQVHRLVADAFINNPKNKSQVNHLDGNPSNNNVDNLEWATAQENIRHKYDVLKYTSPMRKAVRCVETGVIYESISAAADMNGVSVGSLSGVLNGGYGRKTLGGLHWEYANESELVYPPNDNEVTIHFEDTEDCRKFCDKLLAWKRLKDKGIRFLGYDRYCDGHWHIDFTFDNYCTGEPHSASDDLDLLFGGEE